MRRGGNYSLRTMDDIAGCRVIVPQLHELWDVVGDIRDATESAPCIELSRKTSARNYIEHPKSDGYRSVHIITQHQSCRFDYKGLHCETQVRTKLQHAWSTALETYDMISRKSLKTGGGSQEERRLFACVSELFALTEGAPDVPEVPRDRYSLVKELRSLESRLSVFARLKASMGSVSFVSGSEDIEDDAMCLLDIDYAQQATNIYVFPPDQALRAQREYAKREGEKARADADPLRDVLLVRVSSFRNLADGYPNYSTDIAYVFEVLETLVGDFWSR